MERETFLTSAVQWLEDDMQQFQTLWDEVKELKLDQALAQANLDRRLQDLDYLSSSLEQLQADHDTLRRTMSWEDEMRRVWEAIDTHTRSLGYEDFKERVGTQVVREEAFQRQDRCAEEMLGTISLDLHKKKASTSVGPSAAPQKQSGRQY